MSDDPRAPVIVGVAESDLGETGLSILELQTQGSLRALADAGLTMADVDGLATNGVSRFSVPQVAEYFGIVPRWSDSSFAGGASYEMFVGHAADALRAGHCETVLISYGSNQRSAKSRRLGGVPDPHTPFAQFEVPYGPLYPMSMYAMAAQRHFHDHGTTSEQMAGVAVAAREWALRNPAAFRHSEGPLSVADVLATKMISSPLHAADCCLVTDGGGAVVMTTAERARALPGGAVRVLGFGEATTHDSIAGMCRTSGGLTMTGATTSARDALGEAGIVLADVDVAELYDSFTITVLLTLEAIGFCERGESGTFVERGGLLPSAPRPVNTTGGGLSYCHPGMFGIFLVIEAVRQLRNECGDPVADGGRQVPGAEVALCHGTGGIFSTHSTLVLGADR